MNVNCVVVSIRFQSFAASSQSLAQTYNLETPPARGFMPTADQVTSPIDSINTVNGNLHLQVPLASMPKGRAGWGFDLDLVYDSHLYDVIVESERQALDDQATTAGWNDHLVTPR